MAQPQPAPPPTGAAPKTNGLAIAALVCGIGAFVLLGIVGGALALIFG